MLIEVTATAGSGIAFFFFNSHSAKIAAIDVSANVSQLLVTIKTYLVDGLVIKSSN